MNKILLQLYQKSIYFQVLIMRNVLGLRMEKSGTLERTQIADQIYGFRIPDRWEADANLPTFYF